MLKKITIVENIKYATSMTIVSDNQNRSQTMSFKPNTTLEEC